MDRKPNTVVVLGATGHFGGRICRRLAEMDYDNAVFHRLMRVWMTLGVFALLAMLTLFYLMVARQG
jgi:nucleoside-diphosphate-sugar epimerase